MRKHFILSLVLVSIFLSGLVSQGFTQTITHGPIIGGVTSNSAVFVVRADMEADVQIELSLTEDFSDIILTLPVQTVTSATDFFGKLSTDLLTPNTFYYYRSTINDDPPRYDGARSFRTFPVEGTPSTFTFLAGSGSSKPNSSVEEDMIFSRMAIEDGDAAFFLHLGDWAGLFNSPENKICTFFSLNVILVS